MRTCKNISTSFILPAAPPLNSTERLQDAYSAPPVSAQMRKETKQSYANLRSLLQKYDKGERR